MNPARAAHNRAMDLAFFADRARAAGDTDEATRLYAAALDHELAALRALRDPSPTTHAVLHRSAAWLALDCNDVRLAEKLASVALAADPPPPIGDELHEVREQARLRGNG